MQEQDGTPGVAVVQSLQRGLEVIRAFDADHQHMTLTEVAKRTGLTRATARRFLHTLVALGYMNSDGRVFSLRARVLELGHSYLYSMSLPEIAQPHLRRLTEEVQESSSVSILDGSDIVYVARVPMRRIMTASISVGTRFPAHITSMGRAILAGMTDEALERWLDDVSFIAPTPFTITTRRGVLDAVQEVRDNGWALVDQELELGLRSIAVPIVDASGSTVAAANISVSAAHGPEDQVTGTLLPPLRRAAADISADLERTRVR